MPYIDIRVEFDKEIEDAGTEYEYAHYTPTLVSFLESDLSHADTDSIAEAAGQSDLYTVGVANAFLNALGGGEEKVRSW